MVTDAMSKQELQKFLPSKTRLATSDTPVVAVEPETKKPVRRGRSKKAKADQ